jgi:signal transduction histidine kinase
LVFSICETSDGNFWLGTSNGLINFNPHTGEMIEHYNKNNGLADNTIHCVIADSHNNLWLSSSKGISKFNIKTKTVSNFDKRDGLHDNEFLRIAAIRSANGFLYFSGRFGVTYFHPDSIETDPNTSNVILTGINIFNKPVQEYPNIRFSQNISGVPELHLNHNYNFLIIEFAVPNFVHPEKCQFRYKLENFDKNWHTVQDQYNANYTNLPPGKYTFKIEASNNQGVWGNKLTSLYIEIRPPFWQTWWFRLLFLVIITSAIYLGYVIKLRLISKRQEELERLIQERTSELMERNEKIDKQAQELDIYSKNLKLNNDLLVEKQAYIENQAAQLLSQNEQLKTLNSTKDKFFSIIAHDLKNPFNIILGFSDLLIRNESRLSQEKRSLYQQNIYNSSKAANSLLENLLFWSRSQTGNIQYEPTFINVHKLVKETLLLFQSDTHKKRIKVLEDIDPKTLVYADENMLKTIIRNLISNAVKFTFEEGFISISASLDETEAIISIADSGTGISQENQRLLFDINTNFTTQGTSKENGTGLGLILCKEFVEKNNGKIWVESEEGKGSKFIFTLPLNPLN